MLTGIKVSSLEGKGVFSRPKHSAYGRHLKLNFEGPLKCKDEINEQTRGQSVDEKMGPFVKLSFLLSQLLLLNCRKKDFLCIFC